MSPPRRAAMITVTTHMAPGPVIKHLTQVFTASMFYIKWNSNYLLLLIITHFKSQDCWKFRQMRQVQKNPGFIVSMLTWPKYLYSSWQLCWRLTEEAEENREGWRWKRRCCSERCLPVQREFYQWGSIHHWPLAFLMHCIWGTWRLLLMPADPVSTDTWRDGALVCFMIPCFIFNFSLTSSFFLFSLLFFFYFI